MSIKVPISVGELVDKITILEIKTKEITDTEKIDNIQKELDQLNRAADDELMKSQELRLLKSRLYQINEKLWSIEDDLRQMERHKIFDTDFIESARLVYFTNDERSQIKREINQLTDSDLIEEKSYTSY